MVKSMKAASDVIPSHRYMYFTGGVRSLQEVKIARMPEAKAIIENRIWIIPSVYGKSAVPMQPIPEVMRSRGRILPFMDFLNRYAPPKIVAPRINVELLKIRAVDPTPNSLM